MPFDMRGAVIEAFIDRGEDSFDISAIQGLANSLTSMKLTFKAGGASSCELTLSPPFDVAKSIIESGLLGIGFPAVGGGSSILNFSSVGDVLAGVASYAGVSVVKDVVGSFFSGPIQKVEKGKGDPSAKPVRSNTAVSLRVKWKYTDGSKYSESPMFFGILHPPSVSFGEEISITLNATDGIGGVLARMDIPETRDGLKVSEVVQKIADKMSATIIWHKNSESRASNKTVKEQQDVNLLVYLNEVLEKIGCTFMMGDITKDGKISINIISHEDLNETNPVCTLAMYRQIYPDPGSGAPVYPVNSVESNISHAFSMGMMKGSTHVAVDSNKKKAKLYRNDASDYKRKSVGKTAEGKMPEAHSTIGVKTSLPAKDFESGFHNKSVEMNKEHPEEGFQDNQEYFNDSIEKGWEMNLSGPGIPWVQPLQLVRVDIGGIRHLTGLYKVKEITHTVDQNGAQTDFALYKNVGLSDIEDIGGISMNTREPEYPGDASQDSFGNSVGGIIDSAATLLG